MISDQTVNRALEIAARSGANHDYFFGKLDSPHWIAPLRARGRFLHPPKVERRGTVMRLTRWPEGEYLLRMASTAPEEVYSALSEAPLADNDNSYVHQVVLEIATALPGRLAAVLARIETAWISTQPFLFGLYPERSAQLIRHLAENDEPHAALELADVVLEVRGPSAADDQGNPETAVWHSIPEPIARMATWDLEQVFTEAVHPLAKVAPDRTLSLLCNKLSHAVSVHCSRNQNNEQDYSIIWRPEIASNGHEDVLDRFVSAVRDTALSISDGTRNGPALVLALLKKQKWPIFRRITNYVLTSSQQTLLEHVRGTLADERNYDSASNDPEFNGLLHKWFAQLPPGDQEIVVRLIDREPDMASYRRYFTETLKVSDLGKELKHVSDTRRLTWLSVIRDALPENHKDIYQALAAEYGEPEYPHHPVQSFSAWGAQSPLESNDIEQRSIPELISYIRDWRQADGFSPQAPTISGLGDRLRALATEHPGHFAPHMGLFLDRTLHPTYLRSVIDGFTEAMKLGKIFGVLPAVDALAWILTTTPYENDEREFFNQDPGWNWAHMSSARFMSELFLHEQLLSLQDRAAFWRTLELLSEHSNPNEEDEREYKQKPEHSFTLALNSTRPLGLEALLRYARWIKLNSPQERRGSDLAPEAFAIFERHLDPQHDPSVAVRELYGMHFRTFAWLDAEWLAEHADILFPMPKGKSRYLDRFAWNAYLRFNSPLTALFPALHPRYMRAVKGLQANAQECSELERTLGSHLMQLYAWNVLQLEDPLLNVFFSQASDALRGQTLGDIGWQLGKEGERDLSTQVRDRLVALWEWRIMQARSAPHQNKKELASFGWWLASKQFDTAWSIRQAVEVIEVVRSIGPDFAVVEALAELVSPYPFEATLVLGVLLEEDQDGWAIHGWGDHPRTILRTALDADQRSRNEATRVANILISRGHREFRDLLNAE